LTKLAHTKLSDNVNSCNQVTIHFAGLASTKFSEKPKSLKLLNNLVLAKFMHIKISISLLCQLCSTHYTAIQINNCLKSTSVIKVATMKNTDNLLGTISVTQMKPSRVTTKLMQFTVSKDEWNTKEDSGKSLKNTLDILRYEATSNSEKIKPVALAVIEVR